MIFYWISVTIISSQSCALEFHLTWRRDNLICIKIKPFTFTSSENYKIDIRMKFNKIGKRTVVEHKLHNLINIKYWLPFCIVYLKFGSEYCLVFLINMLPILNNKKPLILPTIIFSTENVSIWKTDHLPRNFLLVNN